MAILSKRCMRAREHVSLRLDGELSEFERALLAAHLARCEACRRFDDDVRAMTERLRADPLESFAGRVQLPARRRLVGFRGVQAVAAAASVVAVGLGALLGLADTRPPSGADVMQPAASALLASGDVNSLIREPRKQDVLALPRAPVRRGVGIMPLI